jgi:hypothetical protein
MGEATVFQVVHSNHISIYAWTYAINPTEKPNELKQNEERTIAD